MDAVDWLRTLDDECLDLIITDPPYESLEKHRAIGTTTRLKKSKASSNEWFAIFPNSRFEELFREVYRTLKRNSHFYLFCDQETMFVAKPIAESVGFKFWKPLVWDKCLGPETPVRSDRGVIAAKDIHPGDRVYTPDGRLVGVLATRATRAPAVRLALSTGVALTASEDHRFLLADGTQAEAGSLRAGAELAQGAAGLDTELHEIRLEDLLRLQSDTGRWFEPTLKLDYGWGKLIGLFAAEGWRSDQDVSFAFHREEKHLQNHICRMARSLGLATTLREGTGNGVCLDVSSKVFSKIIAYFVGGNGAVDKHLLPTVYQAPAEFRRGVFDGILEGDGHWSRDEQRETVDLSSVDLAAFVLRFARTIGWEATITRRENEHAGFWRVRVDPAKKARPITVVSVETVNEAELVDIAIDDVNQLYELFDGTITHNCKIGMGYHYRARYEFILFFEKGKRKLHDLGIPDVIREPRVANGYPTEKPVAVSDVLIRQSSEADALVADPFMGSGSTGVSAVRYGRGFMGNDLSPNAITTARTRLLAEGALEVESAVAPKAQLKLVLGGS